MKLKDWKEQHDTSDNLIPPPMTPGEAASILTDELLDGCPLNYSCSGEQALAEAVFAVVERFKHRGIKGWRWTR